jgi:hypothetical protein
MNQRYLELEGFFENKPKTIMCFPKCCKSVKTNNKLEEEMINTIKKKRLSFKLSSKLITYFKDKY